MRRLGSRRARGAAAGAAEIELERLVAPFDRNDGIRHCDVNHGVLAKLGERRTSDDLTCELVPLDDGVRRERSRKSRCGDGH